MSSEQSGLTGSEGDELVASAARSRAADHEMAQALGRPTPAGAATTAGYLDGLAAREALSRLDESELIRAARAGDERARARLVEAFMPLISSVARVYRESPSVDRVELLQEGVVGLLRALERYEPERGVPFWGYAVFWVRQAMQQLVAELTRPLVLSDRALRQLARLKDAHRAAVQDTGHEPGRDSLVARSGLTRDQVDGLLLAERPARSTDEPVETAPSAPSATCSPIRSPRASTSVCSTRSEPSSCSRLLSALSDREREVLRLRYGLEGEQQSLRAVGARLGLSAERVRQIEDRALGKLAAAAGVPRP